MKQVFIFLVRLYQHTIGLIYPRVCRFEPTCSTYAIKAIETHNISRAIMLIAWRIIRCNPFCSGGYDPVPIKKTCLKGGCCER